LVTKDRPGTTVLEIPEPPVLPHEKEYMDAWVQSGFGGPDVIERREFLMPSPEPHQVLVKVKAAALNPVDIGRRTGFFKGFMNESFPFIPGYDFSGTVEGVGKDVSRWRTGMEVYGYPHEIGVRPQRYGTLGEYLVIDQSFIAAKPKSISHEEAASLPTAIMTSLQAFEMLHIKPGDAVLFTGGAGGVGTQAVQLLKHYCGAGYVATTGSGFKTQLLEELGASVVVDFLKQNFTDVLKDLDSAIDATGEWWECLQCVKEGGHVVTIRGGPGRPANVPFFTVQARGSDLEKVHDLYEKGIVRPVVDSVFPFDSLPLAFSRLETGRVTGKVIVRGPSL